MNGSEKKPGDAMRGSAPGVDAALRRNPNSHPAVNDAPEGPFSHQLGMTGDGCMHGEESVSGAHGGTFHFK